MRAKGALQFLRFESIRLPTLNRRKQDKFARTTSGIVSVLPLLILLVIIAALWLRSRPILEFKPVGELIFGRSWHPHQGQFGYYPFITGTLWVTVLSLVLAIPPCLLSAIYLSEYCQTKKCALIKPLVDLLAGIPSVIYGVWGVLTIVPLVHRLGPIVSHRLGFISIFALDNPTGYSLLAGGIVLALMIAPFIIAITYEVMRTIPEGARQASLALGATKWQTIKHVVLPHSLTGIAAGVVLGASRALGETMAVLMVVGNVAEVPSSIFDPAYPLPALIANNYGEMLSIPLYDSALLGAALVLLVIVLFFNLASTLVLLQFKRRVK